MFFITSKPFPVGAQAIVPPLKWSAWEMETQKHDNTQNIDKIA